MTRTLGLLGLLPLLLFVVVSCATSSPSERKIEEFVLSDGSKIKCYMPPPDVIAKGGKGNVDLTVARLGKLLEGSGGASLDVERIRQELPSEVAQFEVIEFRICAQYGNGVLSKQAYQAFTEKIIPAYTKNPPEKVLLTASDPELVQVVEACGPSFTTKRVTAKFVPDWIFHLNSLRRERNTYDLQNLFEVAGRI